MAGYGLRRRYLDNVAAKKILCLLVRSGIVPFSRVAGILSVERFAVRVGNRTFLYEFSGDDNIGESIYWLGLGRDVDVMEPFLRPGRQIKLMLDVGANTGIYTLATLANHPECEAISWEPLPDNYSRLVRNLELNGFGARCQALQHACGAQNGEATLRVHANRAMNTLSDDNAVPDTGFMGTMRVPISTIDSITAGRTVDLIKIDVEGFELEVLKGAQRTLKDSRPTLVAEVQPESPHHQEVMSLMKGLGYQIKQLDPSNYLFQP